jgi:hypothetical protein
VPPERRHYIQRIAALGHVHHRRGPDPPIRPREGATSCPMSVAIAQWRRSCSGGS